MSIEDNIEASNRAKELWLLIHEEAKHVPEGPARFRFWQVLHDEIYAELPEEMRPQPSVLAVEPMTDEESRRFGNKGLPFGKYTGMRIDEAPADYLEWLDSQPDFRRELRRYLASPRIQSE